MVNGVWFQGQVSQDGRKQGSCIHINPGVLVQVGNFKDSLKHGRITNYTLNTKGIYHHYNYRMNVKYGR
jgi:hypothetical protein